MLGLRDNLLDLVHNEREKRKTERKLARGFKIPEFDENQQEIEDAELLNEGENFDRAQHELEMLRQVFAGCGGLLVNGNFFDIDEEKDV